MNEEMKEVIIELQEQNIDIIKLYEGLSHSINEAIAYNHNRHARLYNEMYNLKNKEDAEIFLESQGHILDSKLEHLDKIQKEAVDSLHKRVKLMEENLLRTKSL